MIEVKKAWDNHWKNVLSIEPLYKNYGVKNVLWCFDKLLKNKKLNRVLDVGCGPGFYFKYFSEKGAKELHGLEVNIKNVEKAKFLNRNFNIKIIQGDVREINQYYEKSYFDLVFSLGLIEHFKYPVKIIQNLLNLVNIHGLLVLEMPNFNNYLFWRYNVKRIHTLPFHNWWGVKEWARYLSNIKGCHLEMIQTGDFWSYYRYLPKLLSKISSKLMDLEISLENKLFSRSGALAFYKLRKISN